jgi:hypothetical protein
MFEKIEKWLDAKWYGYPRSFWVGVALAIGIWINICIIKFGF